MSLLDSYEQRLKKKKLDIRSSAYARWIDQKCTPDVVCSVADILDTMSQNNLSSKEYSATEVWHDAYARTIVMDQYGKPDPSLRQSVAEYNKWFQQPLNLLAYSGVLELGKRGRSNTYKIVDPELLQFIGMRDRNALSFLIVYIKEVLRQSELTPLFQNFFDSQSPDNLLVLKDKFCDFCLRFTPINNKVEIRRILPKILNPLSWEKHLFGIIRGVMSRNPITYSDLMYNRDNFRDVLAKKPKGVTRREWLLDHPVEKSQIAKWHSDSIKARKYLRRFNQKFFQNRSIITDEYSAGLASNMHHIFPEHVFPEISGYIENLVPITPTQHYQKAHGGDTRSIDLNYQQLLLEAQAGRIEFVVENKNIDQIYSFQDFAHVLCVGFDDENDEEDDFASYQGSMSKIEQYYANNCEKFNSTPEMNTKQN